MSYEDRRFGKTSPFLTLRALYEWPTISLCTFYRNLRMSQEAASASELNVSFLQMRRCSEAGYKLIPLGRLGTCGNNQDECQVGLSK